MSHARRLQRGGDRDPGAAGKGRAQHWDQTPLAAAMAMAWNTVMRRRPLYEAAFDTPNKWPRSFKKIRICAPGFRRTKRLCI